MSFGCGVSSLLVKKKIILQLEMKTFGFGFGFDCRIGDPFFEAIARILSINWKLPEKVWYWFFRKNFENQEMAFKNGLINI